MRKAWGLNGCYKAQARAINGRPEDKRTAGVSTNVRANNGIDSIRWRMGSILANRVSAGKFIATEE